MVRSRWPTLLGLDPWNCYWEWAMADVGGAAYMHRPLYWATLQFAEPPRMLQPDRGVAQRTAPPNVTCGQLEWPGRYVARLLYAAQKAMRAKGGAFSRSIQVLVSACAAVDGCSAADLRYASTTPNIFRIVLSVSNATAPACELPPPCFKAAVEVTVPGTAVVYMTTVDSNLKVNTHFATPSKHGPRPCLFTSARNSLRPSEL